MADPSESPARPFLEWRPLLRAVGIASDPKKLVLAAVGLLALWAGWLALGRAFDGPAPWFAPIEPGWEVEEFRVTRVDSFWTPARLLTEPVRVVVGPFASLFSRGSGPVDWFRSALMAAWAVAVWGVAGGAIARIAVVQAADNGRVGLRSAARFALGKSLSLIGAPLTPMLGVALFAAACALFGLTTRIPWGIGRGIATVLGFVPLLLGLIMAVILLGLAAGWPLMHATVAAEGEDAPDALSRSYSYVNQRTARYAAHALASWAIGTVGLVAATLFVSVVLHLSDWGVGLGGAPADSAPTIWPRVVGVLVHAWVYSYFWSASATIYLILRRDVDGTSWHAVYLPEHASDTFADGLAAPTPVAKPEAAEVEV